MSQPRNDASSPAPDRPRRRKRWNPFRIQREGGWMLYVWFGMRFGVWVRLLRRGRFDITFNTSPNVLAVTLWSPVNSLLALISGAVYRRRVDAARHRQPMVFVLGHWRTGTTLLHDLFAADPRFAYPTSFDCLFPDHFLLTGRFAGDWFNVFLPKRRPMDAMPLRFDRPQEDEFALVNMGVPSPYLRLAFPRHGPACEDYLDPGGLEAGSLDTWKQALDGFLRRLSYRHGRPLVLKSPTHTARMALLAEMYPDARFVHVSRNPLSVLPSTVRLWRAVHSVQGLHNPARDADWIEEYVVSTFERMDAAYARDRQAMPADRLAEIRYEDLVARPVETMRGVYAQLGLGDFSPAKAGIEAHMASVGSYTPSGYEPGERECRLVLGRWSGYVDRHGYRGDVESALARARAAATK